MIVLVLLVSNLNDVSVNQLSSQGLDLCAGLHAWQQCPSEWL